MTHRSVCANCDREIYFFVDKFLPYWIHSNGLVACLAGCFVRAEAVPPDNILCVWNTTYYEGSLMVAGEW
jgi:hypothetical protein